MNVNVTLAVDSERINDLLTSALEGGSNYWYLLDTDKSSLNGEEFWGDAPMHGGHLHIELADPDEGPINNRTEWTVDRDACERAIRIMAEKFPRHFTNWYNENDDAETGDVFLQLACFGDIIFG